MFAPSTLFFNFTFYIEDIVCVKGKTNKKQFCQYCIEKCEGARVQKRHIVQNKLFKINYYHSNIFQISIPSRDKFLFILQ